MFYLPTHKIFNENMETGKMERGLSAKSVSVAAALMYMSP